ncbi:MAG TPA: amidohydrolase family protein [Acidobacteriaceae bacterium]|nr:amidohydrolase family protein [Acidobacteriaceae bacterium]
MIIDAHHHLWKYNDRDYAWMRGAMDVLRRDFLIPDLEQVMRASGVEGTVAVQARQTTEETEWLLDLAAHHPFILGVVGWVQLASPEVGQALKHFAQQPKLKAVRHVLHDEPDDFYMLRDDFNHGVSLLRNFALAYDILIFERHLPQTLTFVDRHPNQIFVVDHMAKPRIRDAAISSWREHMIELAKRENVYCKVSGMATEADWNAWTANNLRPYFDVALAAFGAKRLMFGSDWPVLTLAGGYAQWMSAFRSFIAELSLDEQELICGGTAIKAYGLK